MTRPFKVATKHKFRAKRTGHYASKRESEYADLLRMRRDTGEIIGWLEQVPVRFASGMKLTIDFLVVHKDGSSEFVEVKGVETEQWKMRLRLLETEFPWVWDRLTVVK